MTDNLHSPHPLRQVPEKQLQRRARAVAALGEHTVEVMEQLRDAEDELLAGAVVLCVCALALTP